MNLLNSCMLPYLKELNLIGIAEFIKKWPSPRINHFLKGMEKENKD